MFPKIQKEKSFIKDKKLFETAIDACPLEYKGRLLELYEIYCSSAKQIDEGHSSFNGPIVSPKSLHDIRFDLNHSRFQIYELLRKLNLD